MSEASSIVWFRQDLRLEDNPAFLEACRSGGPVLPVYIWAPEEEGRWTPGGASRFWLHRSLKSLDEGLRKKGSRLILRRGKSLAQLEKLIKETGAKKVFWNRRYEPAIIERDNKIKRVLQEKKISAESFNSALLFEPWRVKNKQGAPYQVFTAFWNACMAMGEPEKPRMAPSKIPSPSSWPDSVSLQAFRLEPKIPWAEGIRQCWKPGEKGARSQLTRFLKEAIENYGEGRDRPDQRRTSRLSPHLHFGEIGPRQIWHAIGDKFGRRAKDKNIETYLKELIWREFAHHLLFYFPRTSQQPLRTQYASFPWKKDARSLKAWQKGSTGYPIVDAGMRELWTTGWMHNRVRMVVASFLVKDLFLNWTEGATWFWDTLVDADLANNTLGWQWCAGSGADASPFFRIFNPILQGEKFDPQGSYVRKWVPEIAKLTDAWIHKPFQAPEEILRKAGVELGKTYPKPLVGHASARMHALMVFDKFRNPVRQEQTLSRIKKTSGSF